MGCIVNGPGEMADADFGYVGGSPGKIDLYVGKVTPPHLFRNTLLSSYDHNCSKGNYLYHFSSSISRCICLVLELLRNRFETPLKTFFFIIIILNNCMTS